MQGFAGFPAGKLATTPVPNQFFSELLPLVDNLAELKVILHLFWLIGRKTGTLRYARLDELLKDRRLLDGLAAAAPATRGGRGAAQADGEALLRDGLERAVARGALLHITVQRGAMAEEWYTVNSANGREVLEKLRGGELDLLADLGEDVQLQSERPPIFVLYEQNIGLLTPMIAEELRDAEKTYPADWIADAFREAVELNKRSWRYVVRILERWRTEGRGDRASNGASGETAEARKRYYVPEGYEDVVEH
jgi:DnaD/phage-associated family protein